MTENPILIEKSFTDAITMIAAATELPEDKRRYWTTSLRTIARLLDKPLEIIPARYSAVRADLLQLHHAPAGLTAKTLQNHKSNVKSALLWLAQEKGIPEHGVPLNTQWKELKLGAANPPIAPSAGSSPEHGTLRSRLFRDGPRGSLLNQPSKLLLKPRWKLSLTAFTRRSSAI